MIAESKEEATAKGLGEFDSATFLRSRKGQHRLEEAVVKETKRRHRLAKEAQTARTAAEEETRGKGKQKRKGRKRSKTEASRGTEEDSEKTVGGDEKEKVERKKLKTQGGAS